MWLEKENERDRDKYTDKEVRKSIRRKEGGKEERNITNWNKTR